MKSSFILLFFLITTFIYSAEVKEFNLDLPGSKIDETRYVTTMSVDDVIKHLKKKGTTTYAMTSFDAPGVYVVNVKSTNPKTKWDSMNIYTYQKKTNIFIIPR